MMRNSSTAGILYIYIYIMSCNGDCSCKDKSNELNINNSTSMNSPNNDDIWADDDDAGDTNDIIPNKDIIRSHYKQGYVDGISSGKETALQQGFDDSYPQGAKLGIEVGQILAQLIKLKDDDDSTNFNQAKQELNITNVLNTKYFDDELNLKKSSHELITKWGK